MKHRTGNLLVGVKSGIILHQVNAQSVMGSGIAAEIRQRWPQVFHTYQAEMLKKWKVDDLPEQLGRVIPETVADGLHVFNLVGQRFYGRDGKRYTSYDALDTALGLTARLAAILEVPLTEIHHPLIGCGLGGGDWNVVKAIIEHRLGHETTLWTLT